MKVTFAAIQHNIQSGIAFDPVNKSRDPIKYSFGARGVSHWGTVFKIRHQRKVGFRNNRHPVNRFVFFGGCVIGNRFSVALTRAVKIIVADLWPGLSLSKRQVAYRFKTYKVP